jgi:hypothetical protein
MSKLPPATDTAADAIPTGEDGRIVCDHVVLSQARQLTLDL